MKRIPAPLRAATIVALLTAISTSVHSQTPANSLTSEPYTEGDRVESTAQRPYTVPTDPKAGMPAQSQPTQLGAGSVQTVNHLEAVNVDSAAAPPTPMPGVNRSPSVDYFGVQTHGVEASMSDLEAVNVEPIRPPAVTPIATQWSDDTPEVVTVGTEPEDTFGVQTAAAEFDADCSCSASTCYRSCSRCTQCGHRTRVIGKCFIGGWLQQGFTNNFGSPHNRSNLPLLFNDRSNDYRLNQLYFFAQRDVDPDGRHWDLGGRIDVLYGSDARFLTVPGLERHKDRSRKWNSETDDYGIALPQAYLEFASPWMGGTSIKVGHFYSVAGYETAPAPDNFFYSHSYNFVYGQPFTHTGVLVESQPTEHLTLRGGYTNGWDVWDSDSREFGVLAGFVLSSIDRRSTLAATFLSGKDVTNSRVGGVLLDKDRHFMSIVFQQQMSERWRYVFQHDFGYQADGEINVNTPAGFISRSPAKWYGINQYLIHDINECLSSALRVEWFRDQNHSRIGIPVSFNPGGPTFNGGNYVAVTGGFNWRPHRNVAIRPELRWDYSDLKGNGNAPGGNPDFRAFDDNTSSSQGTAAIDLIVLF